MRITIVVAALLVLLGPANAEEAPPAAEPADAAAAAIAEAAPDELVSLAKRMSPDPWLVVEALRAGGHADHAAEFARLVGGRAGSGLLAYTERPRDADDLADVRAGVTKARALRHVQQYAESLAALNAITPPEGTVTAVDHGTERAIALIGLARRPEGETAFLDTALAAMHLGWSRRGAACQIQAFNSLPNRHDLPAEMARFEASLEQATAAEDEIAQALWQSCIGVVHWIRGERPEALKHYGRRLALSQVLGDAGGEAMTLAHLGHVHAQSGRAAEALASYDDAMKVADPLGFVWCQAIVEGGRAGVYGSRLGDVPRSIEHMEQGVALYRDLRYPQGLGHHLYNSAVQRMNLGDFREALDRLDEVGRILAPYEEHTFVALIEVVKGALYGKRGEYSRALTHFDAGLEGLQALNHHMMAGRVREARATMHVHAGRAERALEELREVLELRKKQDDVAGEAQVRSNMAWAQYELGRFDDAIENVQKALDAQEKLGLEQAVGLSLSNLGILQAAQGNHAAGAASLRKAIEKFEATEHAWATAENRTYLARVLHAEGSFEDAALEGRKALDEARALGSLNSEVRALHATAAAALAMGDAKAALALAREAIRPANLVAHGFGNDMVALAKQQYAGVFDVGARAAFALGDASALAYFLEMGRAGALLDAIGSRDAVRDAVLPERYNALEIAARAEETSAANALRAAGRNRKQARAARKRLDAAQRSRYELIQRMHRETSRESQVVYPRALALDELQAILRADEALVLYSTSGDFAFALVVTPKGARPVDLGPRDAIRDAIEQAPLHDRKADVDGARRKLRSLVIDPLKPGAGTKRLLISPTDEFCLVSFAALTDAYTFSYAPSGTTLATLQSDRALSGRDVLALGAPDYRVVPSVGTPTADRGGLRFKPLPYTEAEAKAVGDVQLIGPNATETKLRAAIAKKSRWRSVHLACHGRVDAVEPSRSLLALTPSAGDDGLLTALDVMRMDVPADLVVLSACETARGRIVRGEGLIGLTQAFMTAGAPRVICSLWRVDDKATSALMQKFYELWKEGKGSDAAASLKAAQAYVRDHPDHPEWKHPAYWAAWSLWGLPR